MKSSVVERSSKVYLGMESKKFEFQANYVYTTFSQIDGIICEKIPSREIQDQLGKYNVEII